MKKIKRYLYLVHRWSGIILSVLFGLWYFSGFVMMYMGYPELTQEERLAWMPPLPVEKVAIEPADAVADAGIKGDLEKVLLTTVLNRPAYLLQDTDGQWYTVFADNGELFISTSPDEAIQVVQASFPQQSAHYEGAIDVDQWTLSGGLDPHRPLHKVSLDDGRGTELYLSNVTGQIVRDTNRLERGWNWLGTVIHWIYPTVLRKHANLWVDIVIYVSLAGLLVIVTGAVVGTLRMRFKRRYKGGRMTPYTGVQRWHHIFGMTAGITVLTFLFSGLMSMNPWGVFDSRQSFGEQQARFYGGGLSKANSLVLPQGLSQLASNNKPLKEIEWRKVGENEFVWASSSLQDRQVISLATNFELDKKVLAVAPRLIPNAEIVSTEVLNRHDSYYYSHHDDYRPLPVARVKFNDPENTWFHLDLTSGELLNRQTRSDRVERWLYSGLHSLDFPFLINNRPLWDIVVLLLGSVGFFFSVTSLIIGCRRLWGVRSSPPSRQDKLAVA